MSWLDSIPGMRRQAALSAAFRAVYDTRDGKEVLDFLMREGGLLESPFVLGGTEGATAFNAGKHFIAVEIAKRLGFRAEQVIQAGERWEQQRLEAAAEQDEDE